MFDSLDTDDPRKIRQMRRTYRAVTNPIPLGAEVVIFWVVVVMAIFGVFHHYTAPEPTTPAALAQHLNDKGFTCSGVAAQPRYTELARASCIHNGETITIRVWANKLRRKYEAPIDGAGGTYVGKGEWAVTTKDPATAAAVKHAIGGEVR